MASSTEEKKKKPKLPPRPSSFTCWTCPAKITRDAKTGFSWCKKCKHDGKAHFCKCKRPFEQVKGFPRCRSCEKETLKREKEEDKKKKKPVDTSTLDRVQDQGRRTRRPPSGLPLPETLPRFPHQQNDPRHSMDEHVVMDDEELEIELRRQFEDSPLPARFSVDTFELIRDPVHYHQLDGTTSIVDREDLPLGTMVWQRKNGAKFALEKFSLDGGAKKKKQKEKKPPPMPPRKKKTNNGDDEGKKKKGGKKKTGGRSE